jgi:hypothetical protein
MDYSTFDDAKVLAAPTGSVQGFRFSEDHGRGTLWNDLYHPQCYTTGTTAATNTHTCFRFTGQANSNVVIGGVAPTFDTPFYLDNVSNEVILGGGTDAWGTNLIHLGTGAVGNYLYGLRAENARANTAGKTNPAVIHIETGAYNNDIGNIYSGAPVLYNGIAVQDDNANCLNNVEFKDTGGFNHFKTICNVSFNMASGINKYPTMVQGLGTGGIDIGGQGGNLQTSGDYYNLHAGNFNIYGTLLPTTGSVTQCQVSGGVVTFTDTGSANYVGGGVERVTVTPDPLGSCQPYAGTFFVQTVSAGSWTANISAANAGPFSTTGSSYVFQSPITAVSISAGVATFTQFNSFQPGQKVFVGIGSGLLNYSTGNYTVASSTGTTWTAPVLANAVSTINVNGTTASFTVASPFFYPPGMSISVSLTGSFSGYSGTYTSSGNVAGLFTAPCILCTSTGGTQTTTGTAQIQSLSSTVVSGTGILVPIAIMSEDPFGNLSLNPGINNATLTSHFTNTVLNQVLPLTLGTSTLGSPTQPWLAFFGSVANQTAFFNTADLTGSRSLYVPNFNNDTVLDGLAVAPTTANGTPNGFCTQYITNHGVHVIVPCVAPLTGSGALTFGAIAAQTGSEQPVTVTGAATTDHGINCSPQTALGSTNLIWSAWVSAANTVSVRVVNPTAAPITPNTVAWGCSDIP